MAGYDKAVTRTGVAATIPEDVQKSLLKRIREQSAVLQHARIVPMSRGVARMPAVAGLATAYFVNGDSGLKQTTDFSFKNKELIAEEIAALLVIPDNVDADSDEDLWEWAEQEAVNALYRRLDTAVLFGHDRTTWPAALAQIASAAGNVVTTGTSTAAQGGFTGDLDLLLEEVENSGGSATAIIAARRLKGLLRRSRTTAGERLTTGMTEYDGVPLDYSAQGSFTPHPYGVPIALAADFERVLIGLRADVDAQVFSSGIISDTTGKVIYNAMQQDGKVLRVTMRVAYQVDDTLSGATRDLTDAQRIPVAVLNAPNAPAGINNDGTTNVDGNPATGGGV